MPRVAAAKIGHDAIRLVPTCMVIRLQVQQGKEPGCGGELARKACASNKNLLTLGEMLVISNTLTET